MLRTALWPPVITSRNHRGGTLSCPHPLTTRPTQRHTPSTPPSQRSIAHPRSRGRQRTHDTLSLPHARTRSSLFSKQIISHSLSLSAATLEHTHVALHQNHSNRSSCTLSNFGYVYGTLFHQSSRVSQSPVRPRPLLRPPPHRRLASFCCCARRRCSSRRSSSR